MIDSLLTANTFFGPRSLILTLSSFLLFTGCSGSYGTSEYEQMKDKERAFSSVIEEAGGNAVKEGRSMHGFQASGWFIDLSGAEITDEVIEEMVTASAKDPVFELNLAKSSITDEQLATLDEGNVLKKVFMLNLSDTAITDAGLDQLNNFYVIHELPAKGSKITKAAVDRLGERQLAQEGVPEPFKTKPKTDL